MSLIDRIFCRRESGVSWGFSCGRTYLTVNGFVVAMECDPLRDHELAEIGYKLMVEKWRGDESGQLIIDSYGGTLKVWTGELIKYVAAKANGGKLPE